MQNIWDKKASNYQRFNGEANEFQSRMLAILQKWDVNFKDADIVDIGCGTGVWTLLLAPWAKSVTGVDSSAQMLNILREDAAKFGILNAKTIEASWSEFCQKRFKNLVAKPQKDFKICQNLRSEIYDIAMSTMSPAISSRADFERFNALAKTKIYLGWKEPRTSDLLQPFFEKFGRKVSEFMTVDAMISWLKNENISFKSEILTETRVAKRSFDEAVQNICWHLEINGLKRDASDIKIMLKDLGYGDMISEKIDSVMSLIVF